MTRAGILLLLVASLVLANDEPEPEVAGEVTVDPATELPSPAPEVPDVRLVVDLSIIGYMEPTKCKVYTPDKEYWTKPFIKAEAGISKAYFAFQELPQSAIEGTMECTNGVTVSQQIPVVIPAIADASVVRDPIVE